MARSEAPDLILGTATLQTWWLTDLLPEPSRTRLQRARFGAWLPLHLAPTRSFMAGVRQSSFRGPVLTAPFPDVVNCVLDRIDLAPTAGIGNVDEIAAKVRWLTASRLNCRLADVQVILVAHHALESAAFSGSTAETCPVSKHSSSGLTPASFMPRSRKMMSENGFAKTMSNTKSLRLGLYLA